MSQRGARFAQDSFPDHFDRREMGVQQIEIRRVEPLQQLVGQVAACGHAGRSGALDVPIGAAPANRIRPHPISSGWAPELGAARCLRTPLALLAAINDCLAEHRPDAAMTSPARLG